MARHCSVCISHNQTTMFLELKVDYIVKLLGYWRGKRVSNHNLEIDLHLTFPAVKIIYVYDKTWKIITPWASYQIRKIAGAHAPGMPGTFPPPPRVSDPDVHHDKCVAHVPWYMPGSLTCGFLWSQRRGETFPGFPVHAQPAITRIWQEAHDNDVT